MIPEFKHLLPANFPDNSRVWIYQSNRLFSLSEALQIEDQLNAFVGNWQSHREEVQAYANLFFGQFIVLMADETSVTVGGCSTDSSVRFIKDLGTQYGVDFFNRTSLAFYIKDKIEIIPMQQVSYGLEHGFIKNDTPYFDNTILTKKDLETRWIIPFSGSWLAKKFSGALN